MPRPGVTLRQIIAAPLGLVGAAGIIYFALPDGMNQGFIIVLGIFLAAFFSAALLSPSPDGIGVLEMVFLKALPDAPHGQLIGALIVFRVLYLILPLTIGIGIVTFFGRSRLGAMSQQRATGSGS